MYIPNMSFITGDFVNRNKALPWFFISGLKILNLKVFKLIRVHLFLVKVL